MRSKVVLQHKVILLLIIDGVEPIREILNEVMEAQNIALDERFEVQNIAMDERLEAQIQPLHRRISELRQPITNTMSDCSNAKFVHVQRFFGITFEEISLNFDPLRRYSPKFKWDRRGEVDRMNEIAETFSKWIPEYQFRNARHVPVVVQYSHSQRDAVFNGLLDIVALLPNQVARNPETIICQSLCLIEIKKTIIIPKNINQARLQLIAVNSGGNRRLPFALLTNLTDHWDFLWVKENNHICSLFFDNPLSGLVALRNGLNIVSGSNNSTTFLISRDMINFPEIVRNDDNADMTEHYDEMTAEEVREHKSRKKLEMVFDMLSPSLRGLVAL